MLVSLKIRNLAVVREMDLVLGPGLNVITGETGAGKSIVVSALEVVLGGKVSASMLRAGSEQAEIAATFRTALDLTQDSVAAPNQGGAKEGEISLRRILLPSGRTRAYVNGQAVGAARLRELGAKLADVCSQHEHYRLGDERVQLEYLDGYAALSSDVAAFSERLEQLRSVCQRLAAVAEQQRTRDARVGQIDESILELQAVQLRPGEDAELEAQLSRLKHHATLQRAVGRALESLEQNEGSVLAQLSLTLRAAREASEIDETLGLVSEQLMACALEAETAARTLGRYQAAELGVPQDPEPLEERLHELSKIKRRFGGSIESALAALGRLQSERDALFELEDTERDVLARRAELEAELSQRAARLSAARKSAATKLSQRMEREIRSLGMPHAVARLVLQPIEAGQGSILVGSVLMASGGAERARIELSVNPGQAARPLSAVASGGELSRVLLAIQCALTEARPAGLIVFDEVDTGVGGAIAEVIGRKMQLVSGHAQVLCVTHLAVIAAFAKRHFLVKKSVVAGETESVTHCLNAVQQTEEVARMLGGLKVTKSVRAAAREMLRAAKQDAA